MPTAAHVLSSLSNTCPRPARVVLDLLDGLRGATLDVTLPDGGHCTVGHGLLQLSLAVHDWGVFDEVLARGDIGFAEAYIDGRWQTPELESLLCLLAINRERISRMLHGSWLALLGARLRHLARPNSRRGSRSNIMAHYDLGNAFYAQWLDASMSYSAGIYAGDPDRSLAAAQRAKYRRILDRLGVQPGDSVLEIGCGWGAFAEIAAREAGAQVTALTVSPAQHAFTAARIAAAGLERQVDVRLQDYRDITGRFDHIVSIEMFEAVGERYWPTYFRQLARLLAPGGRAMVQSITIRDDLFASYRRQTDFIQQHVFPGGMLPSTAVFGQRAAAAGLAVRERYAFGPDYARTLAAWRERFEAAWPTIQAQGFDAAFGRLWRFYLAYCEAGFVSGSTDVVQFELARPA